MKNQITKKGFQISSQTVEMNYEDLSSEENISKINPILTPSPKKKLLNVSL